MRHHGPGSAQIRILHQIPVYISAIADLIHNRFGQIFRVIAGGTEFRAGQAERTTRLAAARVGTPSFARTAET